MVGVGKNGLRAELAHLVKSQGLDGCASSGANESWSLNVAVRGMNSADTHEVGLFLDVEF